MANTKPARRLPVFLAWDASIHSCVHSQLGLVQLPRASQQRRRPGLSAG